MCFIFVAPINVIYMRLLYEADIQFDYIINTDIKASGVGVLVSGRVL